MYRLVSLAALAALLVLPVTASAHQHEIYRIGDKEYVFVIGSLNEPIFVDDKTGVDVSVQFIGPTGTHREGEEHHEGTPVLGLQETLKVQLEAGGKTKELPLATQFGEPGSYKADFFPTEETTYTYRLIGTINGVAVNLPFTCNPAGHVATDSEGEEALSANVTRLMKEGAFGCPRGKAEAGFPEPSSKIKDLDQKDTNTVPLAVGGLGILLGLVALFRRR